MSRTNMLAIRCDCGNLFSIPWSNEFPGYQGDCPKCGLVWRKVDGFPLKIIDSLGKTETVTATPVTVVCSCYNHPTIIMNYEAAYSRWKGVCVICGANWELFSIGETPRLTGYTVILGKDADTHSNPEHYAKDDIEPMAYIVANSMDFLTGNVIKYISRHTLKDKHKDLIKALHYLLLVFQREYPEEYSKVDISKLKTLKEYLKEPQVVDKTEDEDEDY